MCRACLEYICFKISDKITLLKQSFQLKIISGSVRSSKTGSGGIVTRRRYFEQNIHLLHFVLFLSNLTGKSLCTCSSDTSGIGLEKALMHIGPCRPFNKEKNTHADALIHAFPDIGKAFYAPAIKCRKSI